MWWGAHIWITHRASRVIRKSRHFYFFILSFVVFHFSLWSRLALEWLCACAIQQQRTLPSRQCRMHHLNFKWKIAGGCMVLCHWHSLPILVSVWEGTVADGDNVVDDKVGVGWRTGKKWDWNKSLFAIFYYLSNSIRRLQWNFHIIERAFNVAANTPSTHTINYLVVWFSCIADKNQMGNNGNLQLMTLTGAMIDTHRIQYVTTKCIVAPIHTRCYGERRAATDAQNLFIDRQNLALDAQSQRFIQDEILFP